MIFEGNDYRKGLYDKMDNFVHEVYKISKDFPKEEKFGLTSQLRRASMSVILNYIEGYSRFRIKTNLVFLETSYGSLQESIYILKFCKDENYISISDFEKINMIADEIGAMLWKELALCRDKIKKEVK